MSVLITEQMLRKNYENEGMTEREIEHALDLYEASHPDAEEDPIAKEREACAKVLELSPDQIRLMAGEISPDEMRTILAILKNRALIIRERT